MLPGGGEGTCRRRNLLQWHNHPAAYPAFQVELHPVNKSITIFTFTQYWNHLHLAKTRYETMWLTWHSR